MRSIDQSVGSIRSALMILLGGIAFVLVMASVNVANLLLARSIAREKELATRAALGAGRARIVRQLLTESILFALAGGIVGMVVMWWTVSSLVALAPSESAAHQRSHHRLARAAGRRRDDDDHRHPGRYSAGAQFSERAIRRPACRTRAAAPWAAALRRRTRAGLVIAEVGARRCDHDRRRAAASQFRVGDERQSGFDTTQLLTWQMNLPPNLLEHRRAPRFYRDFFARLESLPGVVSVGGTTRVPLGSTSVSTSLQRESHPLPAAELPEVQFRRAMHDYFQAMGIPIHRGRGFEPNDDRTAPPVAMINETMARTFFRNRGPDRPARPDRHDAHRPMDHDRRRDRRRPPRRPRGTSRSRSSISITCRARR